MKKDYSVLLIQLDGNLASDVSTRCSCRPQGMEFHEDLPELRCKLRWERQKLSSHQVESREPNNLSSNNTCLSLKIYLDLDGLLQPGSSLLRKS